MEAKTLTPDADAEAAEESETLAAGELVWAKPSKRGRHCWWPARMLAACPASAARDAQVSYLADPTASPSGGAPSAPPAWLRRFAHADADKMAGGSVAAGFLWAVREAQARAVAALQAQLTCACVPPPPSGEDEDCSVAGVANLAPAEFLAALREAALGASSVGLVDLVRLKSWARAVGDGWGPHGAQHYPRRRPEELVDKIDLDVPAGEDRDAEDWLAEDQHKALVLVRPEETPKQKKRSLSKMMDKRDAAEDEGKIDSAEHVTSGSGKRQRKKSKYLSPPYTDLGMFDKSACKPVDLPKAFVPKAAEDGRNVSARKPVNLPKALVLKAAEDDRNVSARKPVNLPKALVLKAAEDGRNVSPLPGSIVVEDVLLLVRGLGKVPYYTDDFPKDAEEFLRLFRSTKFIRGADYKSCKAHESPVMRGSRNVVMNIAVGVLSGSDAVLKQGSCVSKRGKKKDEAENSGSSVKRKKWEKASPAARSREKDEAESGGTSIKRKKWEKTSPAATIGASTPRKKDEAESGGSSIKRKKREKTSPAATIGASTPRKKDEAESGGSSIKRKKQEKTSPAATIGAGITITHALPIRQMEAEDIKTLMKVGSGPRGIGVGVQNEKGKPLKVPISAADPGAAESGHERAPNVLAVGNTLPEQSAKENDAANLEATRSEMNVQNVTVHMPIRSFQTEAMELQANNPIEVSAQSVAVDVPVGSVSKEATEPETCVHEDKDVRSYVSDVPDRVVSKEPTELETDVQSVAADVSTRSVLKEATMPNAYIRVHDNLQSAGDLLVSSGLSPMHEDMSQPVDGNEEPVRVEVCTVQQSYASLQAMVPEMLDKVNPNGTDTIGVNDTLKDEFQKDGQPVKKVELAAEVANHSCGEGANGTWLAPCNLTPKKKKKAAQHFSNPAAIIVEFERDTIVPSREELLSTFGKYGYLIESQTDISETTRSACVVFGKSIEAEEAYKSGCQYLLGQFGPPFAKLRLDFSPIKLTLPSPSLASKPPLGDIRKNLEDMISARRSALNKATSSDGQLNPVPDKLLGEMQGLLAKVERMLTRPPANAP